MSGPAKSDIDAALGHVESLRGAAPPVVQAALQQLRALNGITSQHLVTPQIGAVALARLGQGYSLRQVAWMIGCSDGTVAAIKAGRYKYSVLSTNTKHGARGHRLPSR